MRRPSGSTPLAAVLPLCGVLCGTAFADEPSLLHRLVADRLSVGVRSSYVHLEDTRRYAPDGLDNAFGVGLSWAF